VIPGWIKRLFAQKRSYALNELDIKLSKYLNQRDGTFVEAGANNGLRQTNTLYFEQNLGWRGLLIEPVPDLAEQCRRNRPNCIVENVALVSNDFEGDSVTLRYCNLMSVVVGAMKSKEEENEHIKKGCEVQRISTFDIKVKVETLSRVLDKHNLADIDLLSLDVEGYEANVLKGLDFDKHRPRYILVEARYREDVDKVLLPQYTSIAEFTEHDVLYRSV